ncbi:MAG: BamA/TamA family outer membrane protein [Candidatus Neomarinimicrobiota bacterium]|nr:BamA/TamA family outer membrane protein [Candidatus Neomarinimicrobiota bacterium]
MKINQWIVICFIGLKIIFANPDENTEINTITFIGNKNIKSQFLLNIINIQNKTFFTDQSFDRRVIKLDAISIKNYYLTNGYLDVAVIDSFQINQNKADIFFRISEGKQYYLNTINITGNYSISDKEIFKILNLKKKKPFNPVAIQINRNRLDDRYFELSKLFTNIKIEPKITDSVIVNISINEGPDVFIDKIFIEGINESLDSNLVYRELLFSKKDKYLKSAIDLSQRKLMEIGIFSMAAITPIKNTTNDTTVNLLIELREMNRREILSSGGYYPITVNEGVDQVIALAGDIAWKDRRVLNSVASFQVKSSLAIPFEAGYQYPRFTFDMLISNQWILGLRIPSELKGFFQSFRNYNQDEGIYRYGFQLANILRLDDRSYIRAILRWELFDDNKRDNKNDIENRSFRLIGRFDRSNNPIYPSKGYILNTEIISVGGALGGNRTYQKLDIGIQGYSSIQKKTVLASRIKYGMIYNWKDNYDIYESLLYDKFYLGGSSSLRAWDPLKFLTEIDEGNDLVGNADDRIIPKGMLTRLLINIEVRFPIYRLFGGEVFLDGGQLTDIRNNISINDVKWGKGFGITFSSPFGPVRLDYSNKLEENNLKNGKLNLGLLYIF